MSHDFCGSIFSYIPNQSEQIRNYSNVKKNVDFCLTFGNDRLENFFSSFSNTFLRNSFRPWKKEMAFPTFRIFNLYERTDRVVFSSSDDSSFSKWKKMSNIWSNIEPNKRSKVTNVNHVDFSRYNASCHFFSFVFSRVTQMIQSPINLMEQKMHFTNKAS